MTMNIPDPHPKLADQSHSIDILAARSGYADYGVVEIFLDRTDTELIEISPETAAAKLVVDLLMLLRQFEPELRQHTISQRHNLVDPVRRLIIPLISGNTPYLEGTTNPEQMFVSMLNWLKSSSSPDQQMALPVTKMPLANVNREVFVLDNTTLAVFLTLDVLLDGADIRQAMNRSVKLNMPQMFNCLCHLILNSPAWRNTDQFLDLDRASARRKLLTNCLRQLQNDEITRRETGLDEAMFAPFIDPTQHH